MCSAGRGRGRDTGSWPAPQNVLQSVVLTNDTIRHTLDVVICMARKFQLPSVPETTPKNIRFPNEIIQQVDEAIQGTNVTFSRFVIEATRVALENLAEEEDETKKE